MAVTRFAPSPTGGMHLGHVYAAERAWRAARDTGGTYLVRLEDIDPQRCRPAYAAAMLEDLAWLGLGSELPVRVQSEHLAEYRAVLAHLAERGLLYPCFCSRAAVAREAAASAAAPHGPDGAPLYPGICRALPQAARQDRLAANAPHVWRLDMQAALSQTRPGRFYDRGQGWVEAQPAAFGDLVLGRRDVPASYHLCVTHDDALQNVTLVTRGEDLRPATHIHVLLQALMGWPTPEYHHHKLLRGPDGTRLAKRHGAAGIAELRAAGWDAAKVLRAARLAQN